MPIVSVIVPVYNVEKYVGRCIESVLSQTVSDWELILVDDAGNDDSMSIVKDYASRDKRIKYIESNKNEGPMVARDKGCKMSSGDYIMFLDGDDTLPNKAIELLYTKIKDKQVDCVKGNIIIITNDSKKIPFPSNSLPYGNNIEHILKALLEEKVTHNITACLFSRSLLIENKINTVEGMKNSEDAYLFYQLARNMKRGMIVIPDVVYNYHFNESSSTHAVVKDETIMKMLVTQKYKIDLINDYPSLSRDVSHAVVRYLEFMSLKYGSKKIKTYAREFGIEKYVSIKYTLKFLSIKDYSDIAKYLICKYLK